MSCNNDWAPLKEIIVGTAKGYRTPELNKSFKSCQFPEYDEKDIPDIQLHFAPAMVIDHGRTSVWGHGLSCHVCLLRPKSRGEVTLKSSDPFEDPLIDPSKVVL